MPSGTVPLSISSYNNLFPYYLLSRVEAFDITTEASDINT